MLKILTLFSLIACSTGEKIEGLDFNKLRIGITSYMSVDEMFGKPHKEFQMKNQFKSCGKLSDYLVVREYKIQKTKNGGDKATLFFNKNKILCSTQEHGIDP